MIEVFDLVTENEQLFLEPGEAPAANRRWLVEGEQAWIDETDKLLLCIQSEVFNLDVMERLTAVQ